MLRGYYFGEKLNKQNGHHWLVDGGIIPPPPTPIVMLTEGILYISGGNRIVTDGGILNHLNMSAPYSVVSHNGKPYFYPCDVGDTGWEIDPYDPAINIAGSVIGSRYADVRPWITDMDIFKYVNTTIYYSFERYFQIDAPEVITYNNYIAEHGSARMHIRFKPNPDDPAYMQELERNLCIGKASEHVSSYCATPNQIVPGIGRATKCQFYIQGDIYVDEAHVLGSPEPILLNVTNGANIQANPTPIEYLHGFRIGDALELVSTYATPSTTQGLSVNVWRGYFSFPFDYQNDTSAPYLSLKVEVFYD